jgi:palmitoyltransferase
MRLFPKTPSDRIAYVFALVMIHVVGFFELLVVVPYIDAVGDRTYWLHVICGLTLYFNVISSFFLLFTVDSSTCGVVLPTLKLPGWMYCQECCTTAPPRSRHCWICNVCVLRRDHHCIFTGNCVGHKNQRYFLTLLLYLTIGAAYANYLNMDYTLEAVGGELSFRAILTMILPLLSWTLGLSGAYTFAVSFVSAMCIVGFLLFAVLFVYHGRNLYHGQTCFEAGNGIHEYDCGPLENLRQVFGRRWYIAWLNPFIVSPLPGNGMEFRPRYRFENVKDM